MSKSSTTRTTPSDDQWEEAILSILEPRSEPIQFRKLRKQVLDSLHLDKCDLQIHPTFKTMVEQLKEKGSLVLDNNGKVKLSNKRKKEYEMESRKKRKIDHDDTMTKKTPCEGNPDGETRVFIGSLPRIPDRAFLEKNFPGVTHVKWLTDKDSGVFFGSVFVEMSNSQAAANAVAKNNELLNTKRRLRVKYEAARPGDSWPPKHKDAVAGGGSLAKLVKKSKQSAPDNKATTTTTSGAESSASTSSPRIKQYACLGDGCLELRPVWSDARKHMKTCTKCQLTGKPDLQQSAAKATEIVNADPELKASLAAKARPWKTFRKRN